MKLDKILKSKLLFYVAVVLMIINVVGYVSVGSMECVVIFAVATYVSNHFTKNRAVDILAGLFIANILFGCGRVKEGFEEAHTKDSDKLKKVAAALHTKGKSKPSSKCKAGEHRNKKGICVAAAKETLAIANKLQKSGQ